MVIALVVGTLLVVIATAVGLMLYSDKLETSRAKKLGRNDRSRV